MLGRVPTPEIEAGMYLIELLFKIGPVRGEMPLVEADFEPWERRRGIELAPWQVEALEQMSQTYLRQMHAAREPSALSPWPKARGMWKLVCDEKARADAEARKAAEEKRKTKEQAPNDGRKRHRNPPKG